MYILAHSEKHVRRMQLCFRELGYIIGEAWILRPNDIVLENYDLAFDSKSDEIISMEQLKQQMIEKICFSLMKLFYLQVRSIRR